jgi:hypothetical protein
MSNRGIGRPGALINYYIKHHTYNRKRVPGRGGGGETVGMALSYHRATMPVYGTWPVVIGNEALSRI